MNPRIRLLPTLCALCLCPSLALPQEKDKPNPAETVVRVYNVQDLIAPPRDFPLSTSTYGRSFVAPSGQPVTAQVDIAPAPVSLFGAPTKPESPARRNTPGSAHNEPASAVAPDSPDTTGVDRLIKLIEDEISPETWKDMGGTIGAIHDFSGSLVITQTIENHKRIVDLLSQLAREQGGMVRVQADWLILAPGDVQKLTKNAQANEALAQVDPAAINNLSAAARHFSGQTLSRNGQTVYLISGLARSVVTSVTPVVSTGVAAYSTDAATVSGGIALEVNPHVNWDLKSALVNLSSTFSDPAQVANESVGVVVPPSTQPAGGQLTLMAPTGAWQPFSRVVQDMRTTVRVPLGVPIIAASMTLKPDTKAEDEKVLVLILKVTASK